MIALNDDDGGGGGDDDVDDDYSYSSYSFLTSALYGVSCQCHAPAAFDPGKGPPVSNVQEAGWVSEPVWTQRLEEKSFTPAGDRTPIARRSSP
jgi:hypothetical protein